MSAAIPTLEGLALIGLEFESGFVPLQGQGVSTDLVVDALIRILGFTLLAGATAASVAVVYRWYSADEIPDGVAVLAGVTVVAAWLNTRHALGDAILGEEVALFAPETAVYTVVTFAVSAIAADGGRRVGDYVARDVFAVTAPRTIDEMTQLVRSAGRVITVELPETIEDVDGYDPVTEETKADLAGTTLLFPRRLTVDDLRERLVARLERDYGVGHVDVELTVDGTVEYLAVGSRPAGLGPTLAPGQVAIAIRADPAADASSGDAVEVWRGGSAPDGSVGSSGGNGDRGKGTNAGSSSRVAAAELRAATGDVATVSMAADDASDVDPGIEYRLVTLPGTPDAGRELVSLLRAANETVTTTTASSDPGGLAGQTVGSLPVAVLALEREGRAIGLPDDAETITEGDVVYLLGRPEAFRRMNEVEVES
ncbi:potassium transporter TrkA [Halobacteria archaeon AArc-m2/3/4]|uniref:Potassium transporter TrkA n=1 Tax=Natronoglomus mannanivorans TaxID=2979990 RepID=A0ABT2QC79_9EURY|nr:potassium transporter TrkA [Halobacteria archaeon AArc-m2/3/4]